MNKAEQPVTLIDDYYRDPTREIEPGAICWGPSLYLVEGLSALRVQSGISRTAAQRRLLFGSVSYLAVAPRHEHVPPAAAVRWMESGNCDAVALPEITTRHRGHGITCSHRGLHRPLTRAVLSNSSAPMTVMPSTLPELNPDYRIVPVQGAHWQVAVLRHRHRDLAARGHRRVEHGGEAARPHGRRDTKLKQHLRPASGLVKGSSRRQQRPKRAHRPHHRRRPSLTAATKLQDSRRWRLRTLDCP